MTVPAQTLKSGTAKVLEAVSSHAEVATTESVLLVLMVTDLVGFTPLVNRLGDLEAQRLMRVHNQILRSCVTSRRGVEIAHTGDGMLTAFRSIYDALRCAQDVQKKFYQYSERYPNTPLIARIGLNVGEPEPEDGRLFGACVNMTVRICAEARPRTILASELVYQVAKGKLMRFVDRGIFELKGLADPTRLFEVCSEF